MILMGPFQNKMFYDSDSYEEQGKGKRKKSSWQNVKYKETMK